MHRAVCLPLLVLLLLPAAASASRPATKAERAAISKAANRSKMTDYADCVRATNVRVSTKGPWASASVRNCENADDVIGGVFRKRDGRWTLKAMGNGSVGCDLVTKRVARDLDLGC